MDQPPDDPLLGTVLLALLAASVATWYALIARWRRGEPALKYEPRTPVPWGVPIAMLAVVFVAISLLSPSDVDAAPPPPEGANPLEVSQRLIGLILFQSAVIGAVLFIVAVIYRANLRDFGFPEYAHELVRDIRIGILACLAALAPVYGVQLLMLYLFGPSKHPLVEMVTRGEPNVAIVFLASVAAVVVAPVSEEILFRLLLQGWLEKWKDRRVRRHDEQQKDDALTTNDEARITNDDREASANSSFDIRHSSLEAPIPPAEPTLLVEPPSRGLTGLPYGWTPILISSLLFAVAHFGYGPDPIAIFFLALILGYVYQRTHRIVPCIVAHALFNSLAMLILWRMMFLHAE
ncbi:MAG: CPBP family intramembrane glutamic endopeptidase [Pirellulales bacterium]